MFDENGDFTAEHLVGMGKRMDQSIRLAKTTKAAVALEMEISRAAMTQYCKGESTPSLQNMAKFCQIVKASMDYIVTGTSADIEEMVAPILQEIIERRKTKA